MDERTLSRINFPHDVQRKRPPHFLHLILILPYGYLASVARAYRHQKMPPLKEYDGTEVLKYAIPSFNFADGSSLPIHVAYRSFNPTASKKALIPTCYGGRINTTLNFTDGALKDYHVVVVAMLGNGESSSPSDTANFPHELRYQDCVNSQYRLLTEHLGIQQLDVVIGFSMGGQQAFYWPVMYPDFVKNSVPICGSARTSPHNIAFLEGPKGALLNSIDYEDGAYKAKAIIPERGLRAFGRAYSAWLTSTYWFRERLFEKVQGYKTIEEWISGNCEPGFLTWDPEDLLGLARMWQAGDVGSVGKGSFEEAMRSVKARMLVMPCRTDQYFPPEDSEHEVSLLPRGEFAPIESVWGHIAGGGANLEDTKWMDKRISEFLQAA